MNNDTTPFIAMGGLLATLGLNDVNAFISLLVGAATLGYIITKWVYFVRDKRSDDAP